MKYNKYYNLREDGNELHNVKPKCENVKLFKWIGTNME